MSKYSKADRLAVCPVCEATMPLAERSAHVTRDHPGYRLERKGWTLRVIDPQGSERTISARAMAELRTTALAKAGARRPPADPAPTPVAGPPAEPEPGPTIDEGRRPFAWQAPAAPPVVTRQAIADALSERMLADMFRQFSATLSEWDGAGEAGTLSAIESAQLASLFYDSTLGIIERYFRGSVDRFRVTMGLAILLLGKGRVHLAAIATRRRARQVDAWANDAAETQGDEAAAELPFEAEPFEAFSAGQGEPVAPQPLSSVESIAARQRAWRQAAGNA